MSLNYNQQLRVPPHPSCTPPPLTHLYPTTLFTPRVKPKILQPLRPLHHHLRHPRPPYLHIPCHQKNWILRQDMMQKLKIFSALTLALVDLQKASPLRSDIRS